MTVDLTFDTALGILHQNSHPSQSASQAINFLADSSSQSATVRERLADPSIITTLLALLDASVSTSPPASTTVPTLRCVGNATINSDSIRQQLTSHGFGWFRQCVNARLERQDELYLRAFHVLYNICFDFEPAQKRCYEEGVHEDVLRNFFRIYGDRSTFLEEYGMYSELLLSLCSNRKEGDELQDAAAFRERLLDFGLILRGKFHEGEAEDLATAGELLLIWLRDEREQVEFIKQGLVGKVWRFLVDVEDYYRSERVSDEEGKQLLPPLSTSLTWCLSDMAARPEFATYYGNRSEFVAEELLGVIKRFGKVEASNPASSRLVSAACQVFGNLLWSVKDKDPSQYDIDVPDPDLHQGLMSSVTAFTEAETLHSITGVLIQLCRHSQEYKSRLCNDEQLSSVLITLCESESKEVRQGGMKLLQLLGKDDAAVRERYAALAKQVMESLVAEQAVSQPNGGSVVEVPD